MSPRWRWGRVASGGGEDFAALRGEQDLLRAFGQRAIAKLGIVLSRSRAGF